MSQPTNRVTLKPEAHKRQNYPRGVWRSVDSRRGQHRMNAYWHDGERRRMRTFYIGHEESYTPDDLVAAEAAAIAFREEYVRCRQAGEAFDPTFIDGWNAS